MGEGFLPQAEAEAACHELLNTFSRNSAARDTYSPSLLKQSTILFQANRNNTAHGYDAKEWVTLTGGSLEVHKTPGDHYSLLKAPGVSLIADVLRRRIAQVSDGVSPADRSRREHGIGAESELEQLSAASADTRL